MNTYLVTLADQATGEYQRILVQSRDDRDMQGFVSGDPVRTTLRIADPVVISIKLLKVRRPLPRTNLTSVTRGESPS